MGKKGKKSKKTTGNKKTQRGSPKRPTKSLDLLRKNYRDLQPTMMRRYRTKPLPERIRTYVNKASKAAPFGIRGKIRKVARTAGASIGMRRRLPLGFYYSAQIDPFRDRRFKICAGRQSRKEVLFSMLKIGKGKSGPKTRKMTDKSKVRC